MELFIGIDVAKLNLDIHVNGIEVKDWKVENTKAGIDNLIDTLRKFESESHMIRLVICEATGGYEQLLSKMFLASNLPIHVAHANKVRDFAKATGQLAKQIKLMRKS